MPIPSSALKAYSTAASLRNQRDQDADVIQRVGQALRQAQDAMSRTRAIADTKLLWQTIFAASHDPRNPLPVQTRSEIASIALSVLRVTSHDLPDFNFLADINDNFLKGLKGIV